MSAKWRVGVLGITLACAVAAVRLHAADQPAAQAQRESLKKAHAAGNFRYWKYTPPKGDWKEDAQTKRIAETFNADISMRKGDAQVIIMTRDSKNRNFRDAQMVEKAVDYLRKQFKDNVEWELREESTLGGVRAQHMAFQGEEHSDINGGDVYMVAHKGIGYWFFTWAPGRSDEVEQQGELQKAFDEARKGFALKDRPGWKGDRPDPVILAGTKVPFILKDADHIWEKRKAEDYDVDADMALFANERETAYADRHAEVLVLKLKLPEEGKLVDAARARLLEQQKKDYEGTTLEPVLTREKSIVWYDHVGTVPGQVVKFHVKNTKDRERLVVLGIVKRKQDYLLIHCECDWRFRSLWEIDFLQLLSTFELKEP